MKPSQVSIKSVNVTEIMKICHNRHLMPLLETIPLPKIDLKIAE